MNRPPIRIDKVFDDPVEIRTLVEKHGPYRAMTAYLPVSRTGAGPETAAEARVLPWFRGTWALNGQSLVDGTKGILENIRFRKAASQLFDGSDVTPNSVVVNINAPMPAGAIHVDIPSFHGATRDRYPVQLLQAMGSSGLFEPWRTVEAGAVVWFYEGSGGAFDYWPTGLDGPMLSEYPPFTNRALVADNDRMYHRIGWIGEPDPITPTITGDSQIRHVESGWVITDAGRTIQTHTDEQIRISIVWKGRADSGNHAKSPLTFERVMQIFARDLKSRGIQLPTSASPFSDKVWLELVHSIYYDHVEPPE